jgi:GT2 family glycosyltransferase
MPASQPIAPHDPAPAPSGAGPDVSVLLVTLGDGEGLRRCLAEVRRQAEPLGAEIVLVINAREGSLPAAAAGELAELCDRLAFEPRVGKSHGLNRGVSLCSGEVIAFTDDDAVPGPGWLEAITAPLLDPERPRKLVGTGGRVTPLFPPEGTPRWYDHLMAGKATHILGPVHDLGDEPIDYRPPTDDPIGAPLGANCAYRREVFEDHRYDPDLGPNRETGLRGGEDFELGYRLLLEENTITYVPTAHVEHPVVADRLTWEYVSRRYYTNGIETIRLLRRLGLPGPTARKLRRRLKRRVRNRILRLPLDPRGDRERRGRILEHQGMLDELARGGPLMGRRHDAPPEPPPRSEAGARKLWSGPARSDAPRRRLKVWFTDFWHDATEEGLGENGLYGLLRTHYDVALDPKSPDFLIYSCFGSEHQRYDCIRIFYSGENLRPDLENADYAITFDRLDDPRHLRLPLYRMYGEYTQLFDPREPERVIAEPRDFCAFVYSNERAPERNQFFDALSKYKQVSAGGRAKNNIGYNVGDKIGFLRKHRFSIAFENSVHPGYTTEKLLHALVSDTIPIYWGNPRARDEFNPEAFINCHDYESFESVIEHVKEVDGDPDLQRRYLGAPFLPDGETRDCQEERIVAWLDAIFERPVHHVPRSRKRAQRWLRLLPDRRPKAQSV